MTLGLDRRRQADAITRAGGWGGAFQLGTARSPAVRTGRPDRAERRRGNRCPRAWRGTRAAPGHVVRRSRGGPSGAHNNRLTRYSGLLPGSAWIPYTQCHSQISLNKGKGKSRNRGGWGGALGALIERTWRFAFVNRRALLVLSHYPWRTVSLARVGWDKAIDADQQHLYLEKMLGLWAHGSGAEWSTCSREVRSSRLDSPAADPQLACRASMCCEFVVKREIVKGEEGGGRRARYGTDQRVRKLGEYSKGNTCPFCQPQDSERKKEYEESGALPPTSKGKPGSTPDVATPGSSHVGIVPDDYPGTSLEYHRRSILRITLIGSQDHEGRRGAVARLLDSHLNEQRSIPSGVTPGNRAGRMPLVGGFYRGSPASPELAVVVLTWGRVGSRPARVSPVTGSSQDPGKTGVGPCPTSPPLSPHYLLSTASLLPTTAPSSWRPKHRLFSRTKEDLLLRVLPSPSSIAIEGGFATGIRG
ncbi:hypothetical protein PR048_014276 [Dryococelus australis]|uniref:Uncharacterized protein n=1 Tax=Dryococelus australis TaxID=614101 RepID=A0ABQ9HDS2_9NEOP|nr:hypothetical protein PR048_014276 [Dryococelus australis]